MDRRFIMFVGLALAVVGSVTRPAPAQSPPAAGELPAPAEMPPAPGAGAPSNAPAPSGGAADPPAPTPADPLPPAAALPAPPPAPAAEAPRDLELEKSQIPILGAKPAAKGGGPDRGPLPPAAESPGQAGAGPSDGAAHAADPFVLPADDLPMGRQAVGLTVEVVGPQFLNINQAATLKIVVRNTGTSDAMGVVVRDVLPDGLTLLASQPEAERSDALLFWRLNNVPSGTERVIFVKIKPIKPVPFDHAATVTMQAGSKSRTIVREPKLKVEQKATSGKVLKGQPVQFVTTVTNPGTGPARNVIIQAKLSPGLKESSGTPNDQNLFEQTLDQIEPGQRVELGALVADTISEGEQSCLVVAHSSDVTTNPDDARNVATVTVVEPKLKMTVVGDDKRFTDTLANYTITVENPGTATAHNARVLATLPLSGRLVMPVPGGANWDPATGKLLWKIPQIEPGEKEKVTLTFQVRMGGVGLYQVGAAAKADGGLFANASFNTDVHGLADFEFEILERRRVVDVGDTTKYQIRIKNVGTKEATRLLVRAVLSKNIDPLETNNGTDDRTQAQFNPDKQLVAFPAIDRLAPGKEIILGVMVKAKEEGLATCHVFLVHDDLKENEALEDMSAFRVTAPRR
jgi:uncharacterized repeat protein (TIGR01451 family)